MTVLKLTLRILLVLCFLMVVGGGASATDPVEDNVVLNMSFFNDVSTTAVDLGPYNLNGSITGTNLYQLPSGVYARSFDGSSHIQIPDSPYLSFTDNKFTFEFWAKFNTTTDKQAIISKSRGYGGSYEYAIRDTVAGDNILGSKMWDSVGNDVYQYISWVYSARGWNHYIYTSDGSTLRLYIDGIPWSQVRDKSAYNMNDTNSPFEIGYDGQTAYSKNMSIAMVRIYNASFSQEQVWQNFDSYKENIPTSSGYNPGYAMTFDDDFVDNWYIYKQNFTTYNCTPTFYITSHYHYPTTFTTDKVSKLVDLQSIGASIGSHSVNHLQPTTDYINQYGYDGYIQNEIRNSTDELWQNGLYAVDFSYPGGVHTSTSDTLLRTYFHTIRGTSIIDSSKNIMTTQPVWYDLNNTQNTTIFYGAQIDNHDSTGYLNNITTDEVKRGLDYARLNGYVLVLFAHNIDWGENNTTNPWISVDRLNTVLAYAQQHNLSSYTMHQLVSPPPAVSFDNGSIFLNESNETVNVDRLRMSEFNRTLILNYTTVNGSALVNNDFRLLNTSQLILPGTNSSINISLIDDLVYDEGKNFSILYNSYSPVLSTGVYNISLIDHPLNFTASSISGNSPLSVIFNDTSLTNSTSWQWDLNNDSITDSTEQNPIHIYTTPGIYSVNLTVGNEYGNFSTLKENYITVYPNTKFHSNATYGVSPLSVKFIDDTKNDTSYHWVFYDGNNSTSKNPVNTFYTSGWYNISLNATGNGASNNFTKQNYIYVASSEADLTYQWLKFLDWIKGW